MSDKRVSTKDGTAIFSTTSTPEKLALEVKRTFTVKGQEVSHSVQESLSFNLEPFEALGLAQMLKEEAMSILGAQPSAEQGEPSSETTGAISTAPKYSGVYRIQVDELQPWAVRKLLEELSEFGDNHSFVATDPKVSLTYDFKPLGGHDPDALETTLWEVYGPTRGGLDFQFGPIELLARGK